MSEINFPDVATTAKTGSRVLLEEYEGAVVFLLAEGGDPEALFKKVCRQYDNTKIEQDREGNVYLMVCYRPVRMNGSACAIAAMRR